MNNDIEREPWPQWARDVRDAVGAGLIGAMIAVALVLWVVEVIKP